MGRKKSLLDRYNAGEGLAGIDRVQFLREHDPYRAVSFEVDGRFQKRGPMRGGKTYEDRLPASKRPRVEAWKARRRRGAK